GLFRMLRRAARLDRMLPRLHTSDKPNILVGYAQWPSREQWEKITDLTDELYQSARNEMRRCLVQSKTVYELEVCDDYLQTSVAS
ncbi:MAG: hypothetical protein ACTH5B_14255, partial [Marinomonas sp.]